MATAHPRLRGLIAACLTLGLVAILLLVPDATRVYASNMLGSLRAPGQAAFVASHRGDQELAPENTLPAFRLAMASEVEFLETDIQLSSDNVPVLIHDSTVDRTTNGTGRVAELTLAQLQRLDAGSFFSPAFAGTRIPTLDSFLQLFSDSTKKAMLELKGWWTPQQVRIVTDLIYHYGVQDRVVMASFDRLTLENLWDVAPAFPRVIIQHTLPWKPVILAKSVGAIAIVTSEASVKKHPSVVARMHKAGLQLVLYTLDTSTLWKRAQGLGIDGIITDTPSHLGTWIAKSRAETVARAGNSQHSG